MLVEGGADGDVLRVHHAGERDFARLAVPVELEVGAGIMLAIPAPLQVHGAGAPPAALARVAVAAQHEVNGAVPRQFFRHVVGGAMDKQDRGVALA